MSDPQRFFQDLLPAQWNEALREQQRNAEAAQRLLEGMRGVDATLRVDVGDQRFHLNVAAGRLSTDAEPSHPPFLTLSFARPDFEAFAAEIGDSALGFLGALSGLGQEMRLTKTRVELLESLEGSVRFELRGEGGFALVTSFGATPPPETPTTSISVERSAYHELRSGKLNPQDAFLGGQIQVEGDMQLAMQLALAALTPD